MSRKLALAAVAMAAGLFATGCGAPPSTGSPSSNPASDPMKRAKEQAAEKEAQLKHAGGDARKKIDEAKDKAADTLDAGVKAAKDKLEKELPPIETKLGDIKKQMESEADAAKKADWNKKLMEGESRLSDIRKAITDSFTAEKGKELVSGGKDALNKLVDQITAKIADLKKMLGM